MAEDVKIAIGSAVTMKPEKELDVKGRDMLTGLPRTIKLSSIEVREAMLKVLEKISDAVRGALEKTPPEILADLLERGIVLAGGGALIYGIDRFFEERLKTPVIITEDPIKAVVRGTEVLLEELELLERIQISKDEII